MGYAPRTASEINQFRIEKTLKTLKKGKTLNQDEYDELQRRFNRLKNDSEAWYEDLHGKYIAISRKNSLTY